MLIQAGFGNLPSVSQKSITIVVEHICVRNGSEWVLPVQGTAYYVRTNEHPDEKIVPAKGKADAVGQSSMHAEGIRPMVVRTRDARSVMCTLQILSYAGGRWSSGSQLSYSERTRAAQRIVLLRYFA